MTPKQQFERIAIRLKKFGLTNTSHFPNLHTYPLSHEFKNSQIRLAMSYKGEIELSMELTFQQILEIKPLLKKNYKSNELEKGIVPFKTFTDDFVESIGDIKGLTIETPVIDDTTHSRRYSLKMTFTNTNGGWQWDEDLRDVLELFQNLL